MRTRIFISAFVLLAYATVHFVNAANERAKVAPPRTYEACTDRQCTPRTTFMVVDGVVRPITTIDCVCLKQETQCRAPGPEYTGPLTCSKLLEELK